MNRMAFWYYIDTRVIFELKLSVLVELLCRGTKEGALFGELLLPIIGMTS